MKAKLSIPGHSGELDVSEKDLSAIQNFFSFITPGFLKDKIGILNDNARLKRWENILKITKRAEDLRKEYGLTATPLPLKISTEYIDAASLEEDPTLQEMWANLLANTAGAKTEAKTVYISILKELSPVEAAVLNIFYMRISNRDSLTPSRHSLLKAGILNELKGKSDNPQTIIDNLMRLGLLKNPEAFPNHVPIMRSTVSIGSLAEEANRENTAQNMRALMRYLEDQNRNLRQAQDMLELTSLGFSLVKTCNPPFPKEDNSQNSNEAK